MNERIYLVGKDAALLGKLQTAQFKLSFGEQLPAATETFDALLCQADALALWQVHAWRAQHPDSLVGVVMNDERLEQAIAIAQEPGVSVLPKDFDPGDLHTLLTEWKKFSRWQDIAGQLSRFPFLQTQHSALQQTLQAAAQRAKTMEDVLIVGETGTGRAQVARLIHDLSRFRSYPFFDFNCAVFFKNGGSETQFYTLLESWCGSSTPFQIGTLWLSNLDQLEDSFALNLLASLQNRWQNPQSPLSGPMRLLIGVRPELAHKMESSVLTQRQLNLPSLRSRIADLPWLLQAYQKRKQTSLALDLQTLLILLSHDWPGNISELWTLLDHIQTQHGSETVILPEALPLSQKAWTACFKVLIAQGTFTWNDVAQLHARLVWQGCNHDLNRAAKTADLSSQAFSAIIKQSI